MYFDKRDHLRPKLCECLLHALVDKFRCSCTEVARVVVAAAVLSQLVEGEDSHEKFDDLLDTLIFDVCLSDSLLGDHEGEIDHVHLRHGYDILCINVVVDKHCSSILLTICMSHTIMDFRCLCPIY